MHGEVEKRHTEKSWPSQDDQRDDSIDEMEDFDSSDLLLGASPQNKVEFPVPDADTDTEKDLLLPSRVSQGDSSSSEDGDEDFDPIALVILAAQQDNTPEKEAANEEERKSLSNGVLLSAIRHGDESSEEENDDEFFNAFSVVAEAAKQLKVTGKEEDVRICESSDEGNDDDHNCVDIDSSTVLQKIVIESHSTPLTSTEPLQHDDLIDAAQIIKQKLVESDAGREPKNDAPGAVHLNAASDSDENIDEIALNLKDFEKEETVTQQLLQVDSSKYSSLKDEEVHVVLEPLQLQLLEESTTVMKVEKSEDAPPAISRHDHVDDTSVVELREIDDQDVLLDLNGLKEGTVELVPGISSEAVDNLSTLPDYGTVTLHSISHNNGNIHDDTVAPISALDQSSTKAEKAKRKAEKARIKEEKARLKEEKALAKAAKKRAKEERAKEKERNRLQKEHESQRSLVVEDENERVGTQFRSVTEGNCVQSPLQVVTEKEIDVQEETTVVVSRDDSVVVTLSTIGEVRSQSLIGEEETSQLSNEVKLTLPEENIAQLQSCKESNGHLEEKVEKLSVSSRISKFNFPTQSTSLEKAKGNSNSGTPRRLSEQQLSPFLRSNTSALTPNEKPRDVAKLVPRSHSVEVSSPSTSHTALTPSKLPATRLMPFLGSNSLDKKPFDTKQSGYTGTNDRNQRFYNPATVTEDDVAREGSYTKLKGSTSSPSPPGPVNHDR